MKLAHSRQASARTLSTSRRNGAALVLVLILVVLLTTLAVAMFSRAISDRQSSYSSASQSKAELLARGAIAITVGDLQQELVAGSTLATISGVTMYSPKPSPSPSTLIPALVGSTGTGGLENLVKRSANGLKFYPTVSNYDTATYPPANRAAGTATTIASQNGRSVSLARWNRPLLLAKATPAGTDVTPVAAFVPPDWIVVARDGSNPTAWSPNLIASPNNPTSAIGRYAYTIYDEGGLIDMNVAGYPTFSSAPQVGRKGTIAYADLRQLPGISSLPTSSQTKFMNNIVGWRNYSSANATGGNLGTFASGSAYTFANGISYYNAILSNTNGFLLTSNNTLNGSQSDRMFSGRQQLIKLLVQGMASSASDRASLQTALQYLGIFSRELNRPTWKPSTPTGSTIDYATLAKTPSAETSTAINRDLAAVRLPNGSTGFQRADGTQAVAGEQLLKTRFPLTRINALLNTGGTTIQRDFGLLWNTGQNHWDYVGATGSTVQTTIKRLDQIASESREPNFFELLKAVILSGSVGLGSGNANTFVASEQKYYITGTTPSNLLSSDYQIMQIGANIIDGWDSDNVPTFINFNGNELAGIENLPYLNKLVFAPYFTNHGQGDQFYAWLVPSFWNPHQNASSAAGTVRIAMKSGSMTATIVDNKNPPHSFTSGTVTGTAAAPYIEIRANAFGLPHPVSPGGSEEIGTSGSPAVQSTFMASNNYEGFFFPFSYPDPNGIDDKSADHAFPTFTGGPTFEMQININGVWKAYQSWKGCTNGTQAAPLVSCTDPKGAGGWKNNKLIDPEFVSIDPRTVRFGVWASDAADTGKKKADFQDGAEDSIDQSGLLELIYALKPQPAASFPSSGTAYYRYAANSVAGDRYADLDGVARQGDWAADGVGTSSHNTVMYGPTLTDRPNVLSGSTRSVAELGQVFRDQPWKTLAFTIGNSGDAGLLDVFTLQDVPMMAGRTSVNTRQSAVVTAILTQAAKNLASTSPLNTAQANAVATGLTTATSSNPMVSKGELVSRITTTSIDPAYNYSQALAALGNKEARECVMRALSDACQTRTWNLMIDVIAQSGRYPPTASGLSQFVVEGEKRYWLHIAIDRFTGEVLDQQLEAVYE